MKSNLLNLVSDVLLNLPTKGSHITSIPSSSLSSSPSSVAGGSYSTENWSSTETQFSGKYKINYFYYSNNLQVSDK